MLSTIFYNGTPCRTCRTCIPFQQFIRVCFPICHRMQINRLFCLFIQKLQINFLRIRISRPKSICSLIQYIGWRHCLGRNCDLILLSAILLVILKFHYKISRHHRFLRLIAGKILTFLRNDWLPVHSLDLKVLCKLSIIFIRLASWFCQRLQTIGLDFRSPKITDHRFNLYRRSVFFLIFCIEKINLLLGFRKRYFWIRH